MLRSWVVRMRQGYRTLPDPSRRSPTLSPRFRGLPAWDAAQCRQGCAECANACPTGALRRVQGSVEIDLGRCLFCGDCRRACASGALRFTQEHRLGSTTREGLVWRGGGPPVIRPMDGRRRRLLSRSLVLRQVSAGGCNACEADTNVLTTIVFDLGQYGIHFSASPRHADGLLVTGPVTRNMELALDKTWRAVPGPKIVIATGACAISGGPFRRMKEHRGGTGGLLPVDLYIPGCPPHPLTILDALLRLTGRIR